MSLANPDQASGNAAKIDSRFAFESHVGRTQHNAGKQFSVLRGIAAKPIHDFLAVLLHFLLLNRIADQNRSGRKAGFPGRMLGMKMRRGQEKLLITGRNARGYACDGRAFFGPIPVSTTRVARFPTMMAMFGNPMIAHTCSEICVVVSPTGG